MDRRLKIYFAGPDVFRFDAESHFLNVRYLCDFHKIQPLIPYDNKLQKSDTIYAYNIQLINSCDIMIANVSPFRGPSLDPGVAFEIGYAKAKGKPIIAYSDEWDSDYQSRVTKEMKQMSNDYPIVENFGLFENLMIAYSCDFFQKNLNSALSTASSLYGFLIN